MSKTVFNVRDATALREKGYSFKEISTLLGCSPSTAFYHLRNVKIDAAAKRRIQEKIREGSLKAKETIRKARELKYKKLAVKIRDQLKGNISFNKITSRLFCAFLYWCEGNKKTDCVKFTNSDPAMIKAFITLLRHSFRIQEKKLRCLVHLHDYHQEERQISFWSEVTNIPISQFHKSFVKKHTGKHKKNQYQGCLVLAYYDAKIAKLLTLYYQQFCRLDFLIRPVR